MLLTVKELKRLLEPVGDDVIVGTLVFGMEEVDLFTPKRVLLLESTTQLKESQFFVLNNMGTHWNDKMAKANGMRLIGELDICSENTK